MFNPACHAGGLSGQQVVLQIIGELSLDPVVRFLVGNHPAVSGLEVVFGQNVICLDLFRV